MSDRARTHNAMEQGVAKPSSAVDGLLWQEHDTGEMLYTASLKHRLIETGIDWS